MAQKNLKKPKPAKSAAKPNKAHKPAPAAAKLLKKAAKVVAKKVGAVVAKKPAPVPAKKETAAKGKALDKKAHAPAPVVAKGKAGAKAAPVAAPAKDKKAAPVPAAKVGKAGKKGTEVVLEVPAPKGVAMLGREGKKKKASADSAAISKRRCREPGCEHDHVLNGYCRLHYIKNWRKIKRKEAILASGQLNNYVEELVSKYPDKYLEVIRQDLASEKDWAKVVTDLELDATEDDAGAEEDIDAAAEGVRTTGGGGGRGDFEDDSEGF